MKKAIIGISGSWMIEENSGMFPGYQRAYVNHDYVRSVYQNQGVPLLLPFCESKYTEDMLEAWFDCIDGLILTGGHDINPELYGQECLPKLDTIWPDRDDFDTALLQKAVAAKIPVLAVCRGHQLLNALYGGELIQDLSYGNNLLKHMQGHSPSLATHKIKLAAESELYKVLGEEVKVNSFHHQAVIKAGNLCRIAAVSSDGVIEAVEVPEQQIWSVQWHPEMMSGEDDKMAALFAAFIAKCKTKER